MKAIQNLTLVAGSGQNVGKTFLIEQWIKQHHSDKKIYAVKTSSHFHPLNDHQIILLNQQDLIICEEKDNLSTKDSSRFLRAGAIKSYYIQCTDESAKEAAEWINQVNKNDILWLVESYALGEFLQPSSAIYIEGDLPGKTCTWNFPYSLIPSKQILLNQVFPTLF